MAEILKGVRILDLSQYMAGPYGSMVLGDLGAQPGPQQAVMVKRLAKLQKAEQPVKAMEKVLVKPAAPLAPAAGDELQTKSDVTNV